MPTPEGVRGDKNYIKMKKLFYLMVAALCLVSCFDGPAPTPESNFVDLGLPSGTQWKDVNEKNANDSVFDFYDFDAAVSAFGNSLPTKEQLEELVGQCTWERLEKEYKVTGPNGKSIMLPAEGLRNCSGTAGEQGVIGRYWSSTSEDADLAWTLSFNMAGKGVDMSSRCNSQCVRLVRKAAQ